MLQVEDVADALQARVKVHVLVTSYECVLSELSDLKRLEWEVLIVDEGHRLKNREGRLFQVMRIVPVCMLGTLLPCEHATASVVAGLPHQVASSCIASSMRVVQGMPPCKVYRPAF